MLSQNNSFNTLCVRTNSLIALNFITIRIGELKPRLNTVLNLPGSVTSKISKLLDPDSNFFMLSLMTRISALFPSVGSCATTPLQPPNRIWNADGTGCICSSFAT